MKEAEWSFIRANLILFSKFELQYTLVPNDAKVRTRSDVFSEFRIRYDDTDIPINARNCSCKRLCVVRLAERGDSILLARLRLRMMLKLGDWADGSHHLLS